VPSCALPVRHHAASLSHSTFALRQTPEAPRLGGAHKRANLFAVSLEDSPARPLTWRGDGSTPSRRAAHA
jgi:hypothetical protein